MLDTLAYAKKLRAAGVPEKQAEAQAEALAEALQEALEGPKKEDTPPGPDFQAIEKRLLVWIFVMFLVSTSLILILK